MDIPKSTKLTDRFLTAMRGAAMERTEVRDTETRGLSIRVSATGAMSWSLRYRDRHGGRHRLTLGDYPALTLKRAREVALKKRADLLEGKDPKKADLVTLEDLLDEYYKRHVLGTRRPDLVDAMFTNHVKPGIGKHRLEELGRGEIIAYLDGLQDKGMRAQVNRIQSALSSAFNWAVDNGHMNVNPILGLKRRVKEQSRDRVLSDDELRAVWLAAAERSTPSREFLWLLVLSLQRRDEVRLMRWDELDSKQKVWSLPARRTKANRAHIVPLSEFSWEILETIPKLGEFVFTIDGKIPYAGQSKMGEALRKASGVQGWTLHDLRRTGRTGLSRLKVPSMVSELVINHGRDSLQKTYDLHEFLDEKRDALERWSNHVRNIVLSGKDSNVVALG